MTTEMQSGQCFRRQNCHDVICADVIFSSTGHRMTSLDRQMSHLSDKDKGPRRKCARMQMRHGQHGRRWQERDSAEERENDVKLTCIIARASSWEERGGGKSSVGGMAFEGLD